ncbi:MarR family transcriptional regulator [Achromobacter denitrificans]|uniref:Winged helix-turn-helix transcriptional regulator n=3 Tax=Achromobacter denitrificans TaxID=32002 RepID=A0A3R9GST7_ACHDE|nr:MULTISPECIES: MarR family winged helix-turn-helix transcriptional regulator [Achromobacter]MPT59299.1 MarR family transcriptional regulator [Alcaligenaceae bacterium]ASC63890.1 MarR family transcriptional regulator [Achromobacter denitrificans]MBV2158147.1 MarR family winged helix-turn-helix transcriptional regulator [Achromobacter denitrificans]MDF3851996.1 MarR family winged helix-turn-helix transcriptional regulator [Achromobacter denitrificans]MDX3880136.1 MarR family winged helix-turn-
MTQPALERFLTYRLHVLNKITDRDTNRVYLADCGIPLGEARCLAAIGRYAPLSVNDLARAANLNKGQASRSAQALVERGLVEKTNSESDGRGVVLAPTAAGVAQYRRVIDLIARRNDEIFACLSADEQRLLGGMLDRLIDHLQARDDAADD